MIDELVLYTVNSLSDASTQMEHSNGNLLMESIMIGNVTRR